MRITERPAALLILVLACLGLSPRLSSAQDLGGGAPDARFHWGAVGLTPRVEITNLGIDTNVFNESDNPEQDFTLSFRPGFQVWAALGPARLRGRSSADLAFFKEHASQRSVGTSQDLRVDLALARVQPYVSGSFQNTRRRPNAEIDNRVRSIQTGITVGANVRISGITEVELKATRQKRSYDEDALFLETRLRDTLNEDTDSLAASLRQSLTPLTRMVVSLEREEHRFEFSPGRHATSLEVRPGFEFAPSALVSGSAFVGYRRFDFVDPAVPDFEGVTASVDLSYVLRGVTKFTIRAERDVVYSFSIAQPYYLLTDLGGSVTQRITSHLDVMAQGSRQRLAYRTTGARAHQSIRTHMAGLGVGYRLGSTVRLGFNVERHHRPEAPGFLHEYRGVRAFTDVSYGF